MEYGRIIRRALDITWRHKVLWIFGIAAALFGGTNGRGWGSNTGYRFGQDDIERWRQGLPGPFGPFGPFGPNGQIAPPALNWEAIAPVLVGLLAVLFLVGLLFFIVGIIVRYTSLGALIGMVNQVEETERTAFNTGLNMGWRRFLRLFAIDLLIGIVAFIVAIILLIILIIGIALAVGPAVYLAQQGTGSTVLGVLWGVGVGLGSLLLVILLGLALSLIVTLVREFAFRSCVIDQHGVFDSLRSAFALIRRHPRQSILMWLLLWAIDLGLSLLTIPLVLLGIVGLVGPALLIYGVTESVPAALLIAIPIILVITLIAVVIGGIYLTFVSSAWTLTFRELRPRMIQTVPV